MEKEKLMSVLNKESQDRGKSEHGVARAKDSGGTYEK